MGPKNFRGFRKIGSLVHKWLQSNLTLGDNPVMDQHPIQGGVEMLLVAECATETGEY